MAQRFRKNQLRLGVCLANVELTVLALAIDKEKPQLLGSHDLNAGSPVELGAGLRDLLQQQGWRGAHCDIVLSADFYRLQQTDLPKVPEHERNEALAWALRDMMDFPVNEALLQSFPLPTSVQRGGERIYAAFSHKPRLQQAITPLHSAGLQINSIDIQELAMANILRQLETLPATSAILFENSRGAVLYLYVADDLVLSRQLVGVSAPSSWAQDTTRDTDTFLLEVQRTLDFFESQIARRPVQKLFLPPLGAVHESTQTLLQQNLNVAISDLPIQHLSDNHRLIGSNACLALAAALRSESAHAAH